MSVPAASITVALLAVPETSAATVYGFYDALASVRRDWSLLHGGQPQDSPFRPLVVTPDGLPFTTINGVRMTPDASFTTCPAPDVVVVADVQVAPGSELGNRYDAAIAWLRACHARGALLASACSGAVLMAHTGLLDGHEATSHWGYCEHLQRAHPRTRWRADRGLVSTGAGQRILMAGSGVSWHLLVLALIARYAGPEEAKQMLESGNEPVESIALDVGYSDSSFFSRLFRRKVGMSPAQYRLRFGRLAQELRELAR